jgi:hypothetical protein
LLQDIVYKVLLSIREENSVDFKTLDVSEKPFLLALESVAGEDLAKKISKFQITIHKRLLFYKINVLFFPF